MTLITISRKIIYIHFPYELMEIPIWITTGKDNSLNPILPCSKGHNPLIGPRRVGLYHATGHRPLVQHCSCLGWAGPVNVSARAAAIGPGWPSVFYIFTHDYIMATACSNGGHTKVGQGRTAPHLFMIVMLSCGTRLFEKGVALPENDIF